MILLLLVAIALAPHHSKKPAARHPAEAHLVAARELAVEPVPSAESRVTAPVHTPPPPPPPPREVPDFRIAVAQQLESLPICRRPGGTEGPGLAEVTYMPDGNARISLSGAYATSSVGACVARRFGAAARPFAGEPVTIKVRFAV